jgi:hypothetical protein
MKTTDTGSRGLDPKVKWRGAHMDGNERKRKPAATVGIGKAKKTAATKTTVYRLTHARHEPIHCLAQGLFRSLAPGERKLCKLDIAYEYGGMRIEFKGPEPLGAFDLRILQGLVAMAGPEGMSLPLLTEPKTAMGSELKSLLVVKTSTIHENTLDFRFSYRALAREIGYASAGSTKPFRESIERLFALTVFVQASDGRRQGFHLLSMYDSNEGEACVALNPLLAQAVVGMGRHVHIDMDEVRTLKSDPARLIHQRLCAWIDPGKSGKIGIDKLCGYAWPEGTENKDTMYRRRSKAYAALEELAGMGWAIEKHVNGTVEIRRPKKQT